MKRLDGCYTNLLRRVQNISWRQHFTLSQIYWDLQLLPLTLAKPVSSMDMHSVPRVKSYMASSFGRLQQGRNLLFLITSQETQEYMLRTSLPLGQKRSSGFKIYVTFRPRPQHDDNDEEVLRECKNWVSPSRNMFSVSRLSEPPTLSTRYPFLVFSCFCFDWRTFLALSMTVSFFRLEG